MDYNTIDDKYGFDEQSNLIATSMHTLYSLHQVEQDLFSRYSPYFKDSTFIYLILICAGGETRTLTDCSTSS